MDVPAQRVQREALKEDILGSLASAERHCSSYLRGAGRIFGQLRAASAVDPTASSWAEEPCPPEGTSRLEMDDEIFARSESRGSSDLEKKVPPDHLLLDSAPKFWTTHISLGNQQVRKLLIQKCLNFRGSKAFDSAIFEFVKFPTRYEWSNIRGTVQ